MTWWTLLKIIGVLAAVLAIWAAWKSPESNTEI